MAALPLATNFLAGALLSLLMPVFLLIGLVVWYSIAVRRVPRDPVETAPHAAGAAEAVGMAGPAAPGSAGAGSGAPSAQAPGAPGDSGGPQDGSRTTVT